MSDINWEDAERLYYKWEDYELAWLEWMEREECLPCMHDLFLSFKKVFSGDLEELKEGNFREDLRFLNYISFNRVLSSAGRKRVGRARLVDLRGCVFFGVERPIVSKVKRFVLSGDV